MCKSNIILLDRILQSINESINSVLSKISKDELKKTSLLSLIGLSSEIGSGILILLKNGNCESAVMLERNLYELWCEIRLLINSTEKDAAKLLINSCEEVKSFYKNSDSELLKKMNLIINKLHVSFPKEKIQIVNQRKKGKFHWSGLSISSVVRKVAADNNTTIYKLLSWESHASLICLRDRLYMENDKVSIGSRMPQYMEKEAIAFRTGAYLYFIWNEFAEKFGFGEIYEKKYNGS